MKPRIRLLPVESSQIKALGYDPKTETLAVQFKNNDVWHYTGVYEEQYNYLRTSPSIGQTWNAMKKNLTGEKVAS